jgi:hypothetical protein
MEIFNLASVGAIFMLVFGVGLSATATANKINWLGYVAGVFLAGFVMLIPYLPTR